MFMFRRPHRRIRRPTYGPSPPAGASGGGSPDSGWAAPDATSNLDEAACGVSTVPNETDKCGATSDSPRAAPRAENLDDAEQAAGGSASSRSPAQAIAELFSAVIDMVANIVRFGRLTLENTARGKNPVVARVVLYPLALCCVVAAFATVFLALASPVIAAYTVVTGQLPPVPGAPKVSRDWEIPVRLIAGTATAGSIVLWKRRRKGKRVVRQDEKPDRSVE